MEGAANQGHAQGHPPPGAEAELRQRGSWGQRISELFLTGAAVGFAVARSRGAWSPVPSHVEVEAPDQRTVRIGGGVFADESS